MEVQVRYSRHGGGMISSLDEIYITFRVSKLLDTIFIMLENNFPGVISQNYRIASWNLHLPIGTMAEEHVRFKYKIP